MAISWYIFTIQLTKVSMNHNCCELDCLMACLSANNQLGVWYLFAVLHKFSSKRVLLIGFSLAVVLVLWWSKSHLCRASCRCMQIEQVLMYRFLLYSDSLCPIQRQLMTCSGICFHHNNIGRFLLEFQLRKLECLRT